jgi:hypothetical protein
LKAKVEPKPPEPTKVSAMVMPRYDPTEGFRMPPSAARETARVVPDVKDQKFSQHAWEQTKVGQPGGFGPSTRACGETVRGSGWEDPKPLSPPSGIKYIDQVAAHFDARDKLDNIKRIANAIKTGGK